MIDNINSDLSNYLLVSLIFFLKNNFVIVGYIYIDNKFKFTLWLN